MNQIFSTPPVRTVPRIGDEVRVWVNSEDQQVRPHIVEGTLRKASNMTVVVITHDLEYVSIPADKVGLVEKA